MLYAIWSSKRNEVGSLRYNSLDKAMAAAKAAAKRIGGYTTIKRVTE